MRSEVQIQIISSSQLIFWYIIIPFQSEILNHSTSRFDPSCGLCNSEVIKKQRLSFRKRMEFFSIKNLQWSAKSLLPKRSFDVPSASLRQKFDALGIRKNGMVQSKRNGIFNTKVHLVFIETERKSYEWNPFLLQWIRPRNGERVLISFKSQSKNVKIKWYYQYCTVIL